MMLRLALALSFLAAPAFGEEWKPLSGPEITAALTARTLGYAGGQTQDFRADGSTLYGNAGSSQRGSWRVEGDRYCSVWPPSDRWTCYDVQAEARGLDFRFIGAGGEVTVGRYIDLQ